MGYTDKIVYNLSLNKEIHVTHINIPKFIYKNKISRVTNFFLKKTQKNLKLTYRDEYIRNKIDNTKYNIILILRPDQLSDKTLKYLKTRTHLLKTYLFDGINRYPKQLKSIKYFNEVYSFEPSDCEKFGFTHITNFIYNNDKVTSTINTKYFLFNISSYDKKRFSLLSKIALILKDKDFAYKIIVKSDKNISTNNLIEIVEDSIPLKTIKSHLEKSFCMLDLSLTNKHKGLTFRVFEAIGMHKKIITNNSDIINYDFYNSQNILIIDENKIEIPEYFIKSPYKPIPKEIYNKYTLNSWVKIVFKELM